MAENKSKKQQQKEDLTDQEQLAQAALGNTQTAQPSTENNNGILSMPKTSGTGSNPSSAAPHSLIVHEDKSGEKRYEEGRTEDLGNEEE